MNPSWLPNKSLVLHGRINISNDICGQVDRQRQMACAQCGRLHDDAHGFVNDRAVVDTVRHPCAESRLQHGSGVDDVQSDDGGYGRRGEVELQDLGFLQGRGMPRRPSMPELVSHAGEKGGARRFALCCLQLVCIPCPARMVMRPTNLARGVWLDAQQRH